MLTQGPTQFFKVCLFFIIKMSPTVKCAYLMCLMQWFLTCSQSRAAVTTIYSRMSLSPQSPYCEQPCRACRLALCHPQPSITGHTWCRLQSGRVKSSAQVWRGLLLWGVSPAAGSLAWVTVICDSLGCSLPLCCLLAHRVWVFLGFHVFGCDPNDS